MANTLAHRGPDDAGSWVDRENGIALGHRRLSIIDLSAGGHQPMHSEDGRYTVVFNGEIYNFRELRATLESAGYRFRGESDTEVLLAAVAHWGVAEALKRFVGMFAFALWDSTKCSLTLARDRMGEKPLYYGWARKTFLFSSEIKALQAHPDWEGEIDRSTLALYFHGGYIPGPYSIYRGILKLQPGSYIEIPAERMIQGILPKPVPYWDIETAAAAGAASPFEGTEEEAISELDRLLRASVAGQMVADVPIGAFLSGGIDSSTVVATMQAQSSRPVKTFTIGFHEETYNEARHAAAVAAHLKTDHTELYVTSREAMAVIPRIADIYDEPFADASQIPTFLVAKLARRSVTVSLSGDGGDELFGGYSRYTMAERLWSNLKRFPMPMRRGTALLVKAIPLGLLNGGKSLLRDRALKAAEFLTMDSSDRLYWRLVSHWKNPEQLVHGANGTMIQDAFSSRQLNREGFLERMCYADTVSYLPDDILVKVDRASMAISLESRIPLLDHRIVEFAWRIPSSMKVRNGSAKWLLKQVLYRYVPETLVNRPKMGFGVPLEHWLRGPLRDWAEELLAPERLKREGFLNADPIRSKWEEHLSGERRWHYYLWDVLMFQAWLEKQKNYSPEEVRKVA